MWEEDFGKSSRRRRSSAARRPPQPQPQQLVKGSIAMPHAPNCLSSNLEPFYLLTRCTPSKPGTNRWIGTPQCRWPGGTFPNNMVPMAKRVVTPRTCRGKNLLVLHTSRRQQSTANHRPVWWLVFSTLTKRCEINARKIRNWEPLKFSTLMATTVNKLFPHEPPPPLPSSMASILYLHMT